MIPSLDHIRTLSGGNRNAGTSLVRDRGTGIYYVKKISTSKEKYNKELSASEQVKFHSNCVYTKGSKVSELSMYTKWCDLGSLESLANRIATTGVHISPAWIMHMIAQIASALSYCHEGKLFELDSESYTHAPRWRPFVHCDVHIGNIFLQSKDDRYSPRALLGDFGEVSYVSFKTGRTLRFEDFAADLVMFRGAVRDFIAISGNTVTAPIFEISSALASGRWTASELYIIALREIKRMERTIHTTSMPSELEPRSYSERQPGTYSNTYSQCRR